MDYLIWIIPAFMAGLFLDNTDKDWSASKVKWLVGALVLFYKISLGLLIVLGIYEFITLSTDPNNNSY